MAKRKMCLFCGRIRPKRCTNICKVKGEIVRAYLAQGVQMWQVLAGIESGLIKLEAEALELLHKRKLEKREGKHVRSSKNKARKNRSAA